MKITVVCSTILAHPHGGIPAVNRQILRQLDRIAASRRAPVELHVFALHDRPHSASRMAEAIGMRSSHLHFNGHVGERFWMMATAAAEPGDADVVLTTHLGLAPVSKALRGPKSRVYQFLHGVECWHPLALRTRWALSGIDGFLTNSAFTHRRFLDHNPSYRSIPSRVTWLGAPAEHWPSASEIDGDGPEEGDLSVLIVGRIMGEERYKGHEQLLAVWPEVRRRFPSARLDIVGDGSAAESLQRDAERRGLIQSGAVKLWGIVPDAELGDFYRRCSVFAMPSRGEGFGLVYLEAMAFGKPCIASLDDAAPEVVLDEQTGLLVRYADREGLLCAITRLLESRELRRRLGRAGRERVHSTFTERQFGDRLWAALDLDNVLEGTSRAGDAPGAP